jgi:Tc toxin complex TcA C-terminal TcB-binding domain/Neuraminidase-like domain/Salmonella virulence plasmid 28.1kDa A protein
MQPQPKNQSASAPAFIVSGTLRNQYQQPMAKVEIRAFDKDIRSEQALGETLTDAVGHYEIHYTQAQFASGDKQAADLIVRAYDSKNNLLKESDIYYNAPAILEVDIDLGSAAYAGPSLYEQLVGAITPFVGKIAFGQLTEDDKVQDISFLTNKAALPQGQVENIAMASRFALSGKVPASAWFGMLQEGQPGNILAGLVVNFPGADFETKLSATLEGLMQANIDPLMGAVQQAISDNTIPYAITAELTSIRAALLDQMRSYAKTHPSDGKPSALYQKLLLAGLTAPEIQAFTALFNSNAGAQSDFWNTILADPQLSGKTNALQTVFQAGQLTGENMALTAHLVKTAKPASGKSPSAKSASAAAKSAAAAPSPDLKTFAGHDQQDWEKLLRKEKIGPPLTTRGTKADEKIANYAARLESNFTKQYPTAAFGARLAKDQSGAIPANHAVSGFLLAQPEFDLLHTRIGKFVNEHPDSIPKGQAATVTDQLRRIQRVFKLSRDYNATQTLLSDNIHSAQQVYEMGPERFVRNYGDKLGAAGAKKIYHRAQQAHAQSIALMGNLKSMSDASALNVFPDYGGIIKNSGLTVEIPNLQTLFGNNDYCACDDCNSVYGAAAYLTDMLHYLDMRGSSLNCSPGKNASVKDILLRRRPDIGDIDLNCDNTNTEIPYIDIACEIMEDYISAPAVTIASSFLPVLVPGTIASSLLTGIMAQLTATGQTNISALLTANAAVSAPYTVTRLQDNNTCIAENHWVIRDSLVVLKATDLGVAGIEIKLLHQTLLSADEVSANPEYINVNVYDNFLRTAQRPYNLPFDLFGTEGELYLQRSGIAKSDLIDAFRKNHDTTPVPNSTDLAVAYAWLRVNLAEQTLIFQADTANQMIYWGALASGTTVKVDVFESATGLSYAQILDLLTLQFINPTADSLIEHDGLSCDTDKQHVSNITPAKFDAIHRFLRLWRKTSLTMDELDAIVMSPAIGNGTITPPLAWELQRFLQLMNKFSFSAVQLLAFYQDLDTRTGSSLYFQLFQNRSVTNPLNPDLGVANVIAGTSPISDADLAAIQAALQMSSGDLQILLGVIQNKLGLASISDISLSLHNLSFLYRYGQLAQALSLSVPDLLLALDLINILPLYDLVTSVDPAATSRFLEKYNTLKTSGFSVEELNYLLRQQDPGNDMIPATSRVEADLTALQNGLLQIQTATQPVPDPQGTLLSKWLLDPLLMWDSGLMTKLIDILNTTNDLEYTQKIDDNHDFLLDLRVVYAAPNVTTYLGALSVDLSHLPATPDSIASQLIYDAVQKQLTWKGAMSAADQTAMNALPGADAPFIAAVGQLFGAAQATPSAAANLFFVNDPADFNTIRAMVDGSPSGNSTKSRTARFNFFLTAISPSYRLLQQQSFLQGQLVKWFKTDRTAVAALIDNNAAINTAFLDTAFINKSSLLNAVNYPAQFSQYLLSAKICLVVNKLKLSASDLDFLLPNAAAVNGLDLLALPLTPITTPITTFVNFEALVNILKFEQYHPAVVTDATLGTVVSVYTILQDGLNGATLASIESALVQLTGWNIADLDKLINAPDYLNLSLPADMANIDILMQLHRCFSVLELLGVSADDAINWCNPSFAYADTAKIKQALKARYNDADWLSVTQPLQDQLRENRRDMLIAWLLANPGTQDWQTDADLYGFFLLDVEMCACQPTSRIVQATNSVQLFVQRCFLALETYISVDITLDSAWAWWQWMKYYRLWQANREVFLWPENWIEPDLLPKEIQSPFFLDLQNDLRQNEVTEQSAENAFQNYLDKLDGVARLEVKGMWYDDPSQTLYVFARTYGGDPKIYYFRKFIRNRRWTPWQKVDLDIQGDHIVPVVFNDRVYLFWAVINEKTADPSDAELTVPRPDSHGNYPAPARPHKFWQIQLAFSEYRNGKWSPKKISNNDSTGTLQLIPEDYYPYKGNFLFTPLDTPNVNFSNLFDAKGQPLKPASFISTLLQDIETALTQNGTLMINCYYQVALGGYAYKGSFELDPCRGYPVTLWDNITVHPLLFDNSLLDNMLDQRFAGFALSLSGNPILKKIPDSFDNLVPMQMGFIDRLINILYQLAHRGATPSVKEQPVSTNLGTFMPYFFEDGHRTYYVAPEFSDNGGYEMFYSDLEDLLLAYAGDNQAAIQQILSAIPKGSKLALHHHYYNFYHPLVCYFIRQLFSGGIDSLMSRSTQLKNDIAYDPNPGKFNFAQYYSPTAIVYSDALQPVTYPNGVTDATPGYPKDDVDFNMQSGYGSYNWELFFHAPLLIAGQLSQNQQFDDADRWFRYIFNPSDTSAYPSPDKYWNTKPFFINVNDKYNQQQLQNIMLGVDAGDQGLVKDVTDWANNPFQPHYIAEYRTVAYQLTAVMKYLDHLIRWGDYFFTQDTMESVSEATQLYILASQILGPQPQLIPPAYERPVDNYYQLEPKLDAFSNAMVDIENLLPLQEIQGYNGVVPTQGLPALQALYFCIPMNQHLVGPTGYWNTIADRLYKIRHCLNIGGIFAPLALFAPPIDPGMLVRATAEGVDLGSILNDMNSPLPYYRFAMMLQKAAELCNEVKSLGAGLLSVLEKSDAEAMALLRSGHEISLLNAITQIKQRQIDDAQSNFDNLVAQQQLTTLRINYYQGLINNGWNNWEITAFALNIASTAMDVAIATGYTLAAGLKAIPGFVAGASGLGTPVVTADVGAGQFGGVAETAARALTTIAGSLDKAAALASTTAGFQRRSDEWQFQLNQATQELAQVAIQIRGAQIRLAIANQDLQNQQLQISNAQAENDFMHSKYTNEDLYNWMTGQLSATYFQSYQQAYSCAKQAEQCFRYELGLADSSYINFGYWDSLKKGLLSGEQLMVDIRRMEIGYYDQNQREYELTKHISLAQLDPVALLKLKTGGECWINLPEEMFDMDYPGQYMRRIKTVGLTIPCIVGPYTMVSCKLTMTKNSVRINSNSTGAGSYPRKTVNGIPADDPRFRDSISLVQSIATSNAQNDGGLFELNFHDERYLPFEYAGAVSLWHLELPAAIQQFDYHTISDVIIHFRYTSRDGGDALQSDASGSLATRINQMPVSTHDQGLMRVFSARHEFPTGWYQFLHPANAADPQALTLNFSMDRFPFFAQNKTVTINTVELAANSSLTSLKLGLSPSPVGADPVNLNADGVYGGLLHVSAAYSSGNQAPVVLTITNSSGIALTGDQLKDLVVILHYSVT